MKMRLYRYLYILMCFAIGGCHTGSITRFEMRSVVGISQLDIADYSVPIISITSGPSYSSWQSKDCNSVIQMDGSACITNTASILGIYDSTDEKHLKFSTYQLVSPTNNIENVEKEEKTINTEK